MLVGPPASDKCRRDLAVSLSTCEEVGFPVSIPKTEGRDTVLSVLGITVDTGRMELRLPEEKLSKLKAMVAVWRKKKACTKQELQSLAGHLHQFRSLDHQVRLNSAFQADLELWHVFMGG